MNALILCAGLGTRLRPLTDHVPKPLIPIVDQILLSRIIDGVMEAKPEKVFLNSHHLFEKMEQYAAKDHRVTKLFHEPVILGTAGPLARLRDSGESDELLVVNGDLWQTIDIGRFVEEARASGAEVVLLGRSNPEIDTLYIEKGRLVGIKDRFGAAEGEHQLTFTGISWYSSRALARIPTELFDIRDFWKSECEAARSPAVIDAGEVKWIDIGTPVGLQEAIEAREEELRTAEEGGTDG